jgi:superfamily II DNA or RNA helicase
MDRKQVFDRNSTNFPIKLFEYLKTVKFDSKYSFLKYYQNIVREFMLNVDIDSRGLLIKLEMGMGKSICAIALAMDMLPHRQPIVLLTKSLQANMHHSIHKYVKLRTAAEPSYALGAMSVNELNEWIDRNFSFVSMNASNMLTQLSRAIEGRSKALDISLEEKIDKILKLPSLNGKLLIVDEAHNLFRAMTNGSKNAIGLYDAVMASTDLKIAFLTGTPIANDPFELVPCFNMLGSKRPGTLTLPEFYKDFYELYVDKENKKVRNCGKFQNRLFGLISSVTHHSTPGAAAGISDPSTHVEFPEALPIQVIKTPMSIEQYAKYLLARDKEKEETLQKGRLIEAPSLQKPKSSKSSSYRVHSRQISNFSCDSGTKDISLIPNDKLGSSKFNAMLENINKHKDGPGLVYSQFVSMGGLGVFAKFLEVNGFTEVFVTKSTNTKRVNINNESLSNDLSGDLSNDLSGDLSNDLSGDLNDDIEATDDIIAAEAAEAKSVDNDVEKIKTGGNNYAYLNNIFNEGQNLNSWWNNNTIGRGGGATPARTYAIISGRIPADDRKHLEDMFNSKDNADGSVISLLLVSATGAEGLDLKRVRHIHIMEPYWNYGRIAQVMARGIRNDSHIDLPKDKKNVSTYIYLAVPPAGEVTRDEENITTDVELYNDSIADSLLVNEFIQAINGVSIECLLNNDSNCRSCNPTSEKLFSNDPFKDARMTDTCRPVEKKDVKAKSIVVDGETYYYNESDSLFGYSVFVFDKDLNAYKPMLESDKKFIGIIDKITESKS